MRKAKEASFRAAKSVRNIKLRRKKPDAGEPQEEFAAPPVATMHDEEDYEHSFHRHGADVAGLGEMHGYADEPRTVPDGFAEAKDDFAPDIDDFQFQSAFAKSRARTIRTGTSVTCVSSSSRGVSHTLSSRSTLPPPCPSATGCSGISAVP